MMRLRYFTCLLLLFAAVSAWAVDEPTKEDLAKQRGQLDLWRKNPEHLARLRQNLQAFMELDEDRRAKIIKLDAELHHEPVKTQDYVWFVLDRYVAWLDRLPEKDQKEIRQAPDRESRLALIRKLRDQEWMRTQPKPYREKWEELQGPARHSYVLDLRKAERQRHQQWQFAARFWTELESKKPMPCRLSDFADKSDKVVKYVTEYLWVMLSEDEKKQLQRAEGHWPDYPQTLVEIAAKHPSALPPPRLPLHPADLPAPILAKISESKKGAAGKSKMIAQLKLYEGGSNFASMVVQFGTKKGYNPFEFEFWPSTSRGLLPPMKDFVERKLKPVLTDVEQKRLLEIEGNWPLYPQAIQELSQKHNLRPPWHILPDAKIWKWDQYRKSL